MADNTHRYGFRIHRGRLGDLANPDYELRHVATAYQAQDDAAGFSVDLNIGDPVKLVNDGSVALANGGDLVYGVIVGCEPYWDGTRMVPTNKIPGGNAWGTVWERRAQVRVVPVDGAYWECDFDSTSQPTTQAGWETLLGNNFPHVCPGDSATSKAEPYIDVSAAATTAGLEWRCVGILQGPANKDLSGANVKGIFLANASLVAGSAATPVTGV